MVRLIGLPGDNRVFGKSETLYNSKLSTTSDSGSEWNKSHKTSDDFEIRR